MRIRMTPSSSLALTAVLMLIFGSCRAKGETNEASAQPSSYFYVVANPEAYQVNVGRAWKLAHHTSRAGSTIIKGLAALGLGYDVVSSASQKFPGYLAPLAYTFFVPNAVHWNAGVLRMKRDFFHSRLVDRLRDVSTVENVLLVKGGKMESLMGVPQSLRANELVIIETSRPLPSELTDSPDWIWPKPQLVTGLDKMNLRVALVADGSSSVRTWEMSVIDLLQQTKLPKPIADAWRSSVKQSDAALPFFLSRIWNQLPPPPLDRIFAEATATLPDGTEFRLGEVASEATLRDMLNLGFRNRLKHSLDLGSPGKLPVKVVKSSQPCATSYANMAPSGQ